VEQQRIGIDVGGSGVKGGVVDVDRGSLITDRLRYDTPSPATPEAVVGVVGEVVGQLDAEGPIGVGFPAVVRDGVVLTANNIDRKWIGVDARTLIQDETGREIRISNDADAAALAEVEFGAAGGVSGSVLVITFGTGIGSALVVDGRVVPNLELGQLELAGIRPAEQKFSAKARHSEDLDWDEWGDRANEYLVYVDSIFNPQLIVLGGGVAKRFDLFEDRLDPSLTVVPATLLNDAGIVGAALLARGPSPRG
jgi:polyphosphate glucokinase